MDVRDEKCARSATRSGKAAPGTDEGEGAFWARKRERILLRVERGALVPPMRTASTAPAGEGLPRRRASSPGSQMPRHPGFWRLAHRIGTLCVETSDAFQGLTAIRQSRAAFDAGIGCDITETEIRAWAFW